MTSLLLMVKDTILHINSQEPTFLKKTIIEVLYNSQTSNWLDVIYKLAMIIIGIVNASFAFYIFYYRNNVERKKDFEKLRRDILNNFVLKYKLPAFYEYFTDLVAKSEDLMRSKNDMDDIKILLDDLYQDMFSAIRKNFTEYLSAVNDKLYKDILGLCDGLQGELSQNLFDEDVDLKVQTNFENFIVNPILSYQKTILSELFNYK